MPSSALSDEIMKLADSLDPGTTQDFLRSFRICGRCENWKRLGEASDGGYLTCTDHMLRGDVLGAYSIGVSGWDLWSKHAFETYGVPVFQYDCTVGHPAQQCEKCKFFPACLKGENNQGGVLGKTSWTLEEAVIQSGLAHAPERSLLMKMDIEGAEWPALGTASNMTLSRFRQMSIEFHKLSDVQRHGEFLQAMQRLIGAGFKVVHIHGNNNGRMYTAGQFSIPDVIEVTVDASASAEPACVPEEVRVPLDAANSKVQKELPLAHLPALYSSAADPALE